MTVTAETRAVVRTTFGGRCGYRGVFETSVGGELEMDHFHPTAAGGSDEIANLVYARTACNRFKGDYVPPRDAPESLRLLHPQHDNLREHIEETTHGHLVGITPRGWFHIQRIHLNRTQLVEMRRLLRVTGAQGDELIRARESEAHLREENRALRGEVARLRTAMDELLRRRS